MKQARGLIIERKKGKCLFNKGPLLDMSYFVLDSFQNNNPIVENIAG